MPIVNSDIVLRYTTLSGSAGDTTTGTANGSLGKYASTTVVAAGQNGLFDDVSGAENAASESEYRAVYVLNNHATITLQNAVAFLTGEVAGGTTTYIAVDNIAVSAKGSASIQGAQIANEDTAPSGVSAFSAPGNVATGLALGNLAPGQGRLVWLKRTAANTAPVTGDGVTLNIGGDTAA